MDYIIPKELRRSKLYGELSWKRFEKHARVPLAIGILIWAGWMFQVLGAITYYAGQRVIIFN